MLVSSFRQSDENVHQVVHQSHQFLEMHEKYIKYHVIKYFGGKFW